jgi:hypothetical protein
MLYVVSNLLGVVAVIECDGCGVTLLCNLGVAVWTISRKGMLLLAYWQQQTLACMDGYCLDSGIACA